eukprot:gene7997-17465_t
MGTTGWGRGALKGRLSQSNRMRVSSSPRTQTCEANTNKVIEASCPIAE